MPATTKILLPEQKKPGYIQSARLTTQSNVKIGEVVIRTNGGHEITVATNDIGQFAVGQSVMVKLAVEAWVES